MQAERTDRPDGAADVRPHEGFADAAERTLEFLHARIGMDLWLVTRVDQDRQIAVVAHPDDLVRPGMALPWAEGFCSRMVAGAGPRVASVTAAVPAYADVSMGLAARVAAYVGVPLVHSDGSLYGTLCGFALRAQPASLGRGLPLVEHCARMLATVLAGEGAVATLRSEAARNAAEGQRDLLTGLLNRRGWQAALEQEEARCARTGGTASILVLDLDDLKVVNDSAGRSAGDARIRSAAEILSDCSRANDVAARTGGDEFAVLLSHPAGAASTDISVADAAFLARLHGELSAAQLPASAGVAQRRGSGGLADAWHRAGSAMNAAKRARSSRN